MRSRILLAVMLWLSSAATMAMAAAQEPINDVRILIDISGSMKKNDPQNLRVLALRLITQLLPEGSKASVWTFGQWVNPLVPLKTVDAQWKEQAYAAANEINSHGLFTNIEGVLEKSTQDWTQPDKNAKRSIIFLTDGLVDISKQPEENAAARTRILEETLGRLRDAGVVIHTIGLSDDVDKPFLRQLSATTKGWFEEAHTADQLERVFLRMFEKAVPTESLPMPDNKISVDSSVKEITLLIFREEGSQDLKIGLPGGEKLDFRSKRDGLHWRHEERYDLVTVSNPPAGEWKIQAKLDPDNRAMVVTDLKTKVSTLPNVMLAGDIQPYMVEFSQQGQKISEKKFLDLIKINLARNRDSKEEQRLALTDDGQNGDAKADDGTFTTRIGQYLPAGQYEYQLLVDGTTFQRSNRQSVQVVDAPVAVSVRKVKDGDPAVYGLSLVPYAEIINPETLLVEATIKKPDNSQSNQNVSRVGPNEWRLDLPVKAGEHFDVTLSVQADRIDGTPLNLGIGPYTVSEGAAAEPKPQAPPQPTAKPPVTEKAAEKSAKTEAAKAKTPAPHEAPKKKEDGPDWLAVVLKILGLNVILGGVGFGVYWKWFRTPKPATEGAAVGEQPAQPKKIWKLLSWFRRKPKAEAESTENADEPKDEKK